MIKALNEIKKGEYFTVASKDGGITKAPCQREVLTSGTECLTSPTDHGYVFKLKMDNYLGTVKTKDGLVVHQFSK